MCHTTHSEYKCGHKSTLITTTCDYQQNNDALTKHLDYSTSDPKVRQNKRDCGDLEKGCKKTFVFVKERCGECKGMKRRDTFRKEGHEDGEKRDEEGRGEENRKNDEGKAERDERKWNRERKVGFSAKIGERLESFWL
jgi:hypothetical protein